MVKVQQGTSVETVGGTFKKEACTSCKDQIQHCPSQGQDVKVPRSVLLGAYTVRGCGVTKAAM
eukprot:2536017-Prorocentrum_lima.AAC.1